MHLKKAVLTTSFALLILIIGMIVTYRLDPVKTIGVVSQVSNWARIPYSKTNIESTNSSQKTYVDEKHGFSFQLPHNWGNVPRKGGTLEEGHGISVNTEQILNCRTAATYANEELLPNYPNLRTVPIPNTNLDGFIVEDLHLDYITPGPEAYIINCPYVIRLGFNPTGIHEGERVFDGVISSFKTWQPPE